jgi:hypothetical protein
MTSSADHARNDIYTDSRRGLVGRRVALQSADITKRDLAPRGGDGLAVRPDPCGLKIAFRLFRRHGHIR